MNKKLLFAFSLVAGTGFSQTFDAGNEAAINATQMMYMIDSAAPSYATTTGNGVTWDYSGFWKFPNGNRNYSVLANTNTADYGANTNKVIDIQNILTTYLETNSGGREIVGIEYNTQNASLGTIKINFNGGNKIIAQTYPFAITNSIVDDCSGTLSSGTIPSTPATGSSVSTYDGIGTLKLGDGMILSNVSRHYLHTEIDASIPFFPSNINAHIEIDEYDYYVLASGDYLPELSYVKVTINTTGGLTLNTSLNFLLSTVDPIGFVGLTDLENKTFSITPNPATEKISLKGEQLSGKVPYAISDLEGKVILTGNTDSDIDITSLPSGMYILSSTIDGEKVNQKFIKR